MVKKYTNNYHLKALQNLHKFWIFGLKMNYLAILIAIGFLEISKGEATNAEAKKKVFRNFCE
jgi:hypothetical protein